MTPARVMEVALGLVQRALGSLGRSRRHGQVGPAYLWRKKRQFQIDFLTDAGLRPHHYLLDVGCGTLRGGIPLIAYLEPGHYHGFDVRSSVIEEAALELREAGLVDKRPELHTGSSMEDFSAPVAFDVVWAFSVLIHMPDDEVERCIAKVAKVLAEDGRFYANVRVGEREDTGHWERFPIVRRPISYYREVAARNGMTVQDQGSLWGLGHRTFSPADMNRMLLFTPGETARGQGGSLRDERE